MMRFSLSLSRSTISINSCCVESAGISERRTWIEPRMAASGLRNPWAMPAATRPTAGAALQARGVLHRADVGQVLKRDDEAGGLAALGRERREL